ncbi:MAG: hypothetical protein NUV34_09620 [Sulfuricaulis sp.]|nr:hypothetical protein [Sulfuricaulis sp.]
MKTLSWILFTLVGVNLFFAGWNLTQEQNAEIAIMLSVTAAVVCGLAGWACRMVAT